MCDIRGGMIRFNESVSSPTPLKDPNRLMCFVVNIFFREILDVFVYVSAFTRNSTYFLVFSRVISNLLKRTDSKDSVRSSITSVRCVIATTCSVQALLA